MSQARANLPLKLTVRADLADLAVKKAGNLGLATSTFVAVLVWNDSIQPISRLEAVERSEKYSRVDFPCSLRAAHRGLAEARARNCGLSLNAYLEALIAANLDRGEKALLVLSRK